MTTNLPVRLIDQNLVIQHPNPNLLRSIFPKVKVAKIGDKTFSAIPHTLDAVRVLRNLGVPAPSPIRTEYDWPGRYKPRWYQIDTAEFFTINSRAHCHSAPRCVDGSTEFLTPTGWKRIDQYAEGDLVAQWNPDTDQAEYVHPMEYINMPCDEMIHIKTSAGVDQMLTKNHRVPFYKVNKYDELCETTAIQIHSSNLLQVYGWRGRIPVTFKAPDKTGLPLTDAEIRVMVMTIADGWFQRNTPRCHVRIKKQRKKQRARQLLTDAGIEFKERQKDYPTAVGFSIFMYTAPRREKAFTEFWWDASQHQLEIIIDEARYWDGSPRRSTAYSFSSSIKESAEFIQYAAVASKRTASLHGHSRIRRGKTEIDYTVYVRGNGTPLGIGNRPNSLDLNSKIVPAPNGRCYCFTVPSTYFIARRNGCVFITGNTGKTLASLWAADYLRKTGKINRTLIVAPLSTIFDVWESTIFESFPLRTFCVLYGPRKRRLELLEQPHDFYIINHHGIALIEGPLRNRKDINHFIIDEVATFRSTKATTLFKPMNRVLNQQGILRSAWGLTGTPTPNEPTDAFGQCKLITPENYKGHFTSFKHETMVQFGQFKWVPRRGAEETVARVLKPSIRFERTVCTDMEPCYIERRASLSDEQTKAYKQLLNEAVAEIKDSKVTAVNSAVLLSKLIQTATGVVIDADGNYVRMDFGPRLSVLEELIEENNEKVLVFVPFTGALDALAQALRKKWSVGVVDGRVSAGKRTEIFREFRSAKDPHILVCHPQVMAHGLDLTAATLSIWYAPTWKAETYQQANARTDGSRQTVKIDIAHIFATAEEKRIYQVLKEKGRLQDVVLGLANKEVV